MSWAGLRRRHIESVHCVDGRATVPTFDHAPAAAAVSRLLDGVNDKQLSGPTPCTGLPVAALLDHLMGLSLAFTWAARKSTATEGGGTRPGPQTVSAEHLDPDWRTELPRRLQDLVAAWRDPAAWEGMTEAGGVPLTGEAAAVVALDELVLHGWDLARATGQGYDCDPVSTAIVLDFVTQAARAEQAQLRNGLFGPVVPVPADAPAFDRALGLAGRDPAWSSDAAGTSAGSSSAGSASAGSSPSSGSGSGDPADVVRRLFAGYQAQDRDAAEQLIAAEFTFTSPRDDHIDRAAYFDRCFPTASRFRRQEIQRLAKTGDDVFVMYEYELVEGGVHRNTELITVRDGRVVQAQVFFGGRYDGQPGQPPSPA
jgi:uncharacterized protein (TIGR03086 family)